MERHEDVPEVENLEDLANVQVSYGRQNLFVFEEKYHDAIKGHLI